MAHKHSTNKRFGEELNGALGCVSIRDSQLHSKQNKENGARGFQGFKVVCEVCIVVHHPALVHRSYWLGLYFPLHDEPKYPP